MTVDRDNKNCRRSRIEVRPTALLRRHPLDSAAVAGLGRATPHDYYQAAVDVTMETYYYGHQAML